MLQLLVVMALKSKVSERIRERGKKKANMRKARGKSQSKIRVNHGVTETWSLLLFSIFGVTPWFAPEFILFHHNIGPGLNPFIAFGGDVIRLEAGRLCG